MRPVRAPTVALLLPLMAACAHQADRSGTLSTLRQVQPDTKEVPVEQGLDRAVQGYRDFLKQAPDSKLAPEAMRRLADLKIEKEFGIQGNGKLVELAASPTATPVPAIAPAPGAAQTEGVGSARRDQAAALRAPAVTKIDARTAARSQPQTPGSAPAAIS